MLRQKRYMTDFGFNHTSIIHYLYYHTVHHSNVVSTIQKKREKKRVFIVLMLKTRLTDRIFYYCKYHYHGYRYCYRFIFLVTI